MVRLYWRVGCAVVTWDKDVLAVYPLCCFSACLYFVLWRVFCTGLWFSSVTSLSSFQKTLTFQMTEKSFDFYVFSSCFFLSLVYCDVRVWQLVPKRCFVLSFSRMDLKRARKHHPLRIARVPRFPGKNSLFSKNSTVSLQCQLKNWLSLYLVLTIGGYYFIWGGVNPSEKNNACRHFPSMNVLTVCVALVHPAPLRALRLLNAELFFSPLLLFQPPQFKLAGNHQPVFEHGPDPSLKSAKDQESQIRYWRDYIYLMLLDNHIN